MKIGSKAQLLLKLGVEKEDLEQLNALADESGTMSVLMMRLKCWFYSQSRHLNFFTILILASVPNPLFDLAGIMCGQLSALVLSYDPKSEQA